MNPGERLLQIIWRDALGDIPSRAGLDHSDDVLGGIGNRQCKEPKFWIQPESPLDHGQSATFRHMHVEQDHVGSRGPYADDG